MIPSTRELGEVIGADSAWHGETYAHLVPLEAQSMSAPETNTKSEMKTKEDFS